MARRLCLWVAAIAGLVPQIAFAGGFELPGIGTRAVGRGGAFGVLADDPTAIGINPAGLIRDSGTRLLIDSSLKFSFVSFQRTALSTPNETPPPGHLDPSENQSTLFPLGAEVVLVTDFGLDNWAFALGVYGPNAGGVGEYDPTGGTKYMMTDFDVVLLYYTLSVAYGWKDTFGVGASLQYAHAPLAQLSLVVDGTPNTGLNSYTSTFDMLAKLDLSDAFSMTAIVGAWYRIIPQLEVGVSARVVPVFLDLKGDVELSGVPGGNLKTEDVTQEGTSVALDLTMPVWVRGGLRYRHLDGEREVFDIELNLVWENWAVFEEYDVQLTGRVNVQKDGITLVEEDLKSLNIPRAWRDTLSVRLGGTYNAVQDLMWVSLGGFYESAAVPDGYEHLDFLSYDRGGIAAGLRFSFSGVDITAAYMHVFQEDRSTDERNAYIYQQRPLAPCPGQCGGFQGVPANNGTTKSSYDILNVSLQLHFDEWAK